jgi:hypothetical protein
MDVLQWTLNRDRSHISREIQHLVLYYKKVCLANGYVDNLLGSLLSKSEDYMRESTLRLPCLEHLSPSRQSMHDLITKSTHFGAQNIGH